MAIRQPQGFGKGGVRLKNASSIEVIERGLRPGVNDYTPSISRFELVDITKDFCEVIGGRLTEEPRLSL
ncbi:Uncharacterised protein [Burkholderia pseudomallei]|nr:Uncharacterised protein [Burkholderia pseudomallei]